MTDDRLEPGTAAADGDSSREAPRSPAGAPSRAALLVDAILSELLAAADHTPARAALQLCLGLVLEQRLGDSRRALQHLQEARRLAPRSLPAIRALRRIFWGRQNWVMVLDLLDAELELGPPASRQAQLLLHKGQILDQRLGLPELALEHYQRGIELDPGNRQLLIRLRWLLRSRGDGAGLGEVVRAWAQATEDRPLRALLQRELGQLLLGQGDPEGALAAFERALADDPTDLAARGGARQLYQALERWEQLFRLLEAEGEAAPAGGEGALARVQAARICRDRLQRPGKALELMARALDSSAGFVLALESLAAGGPSPERVDQLLALAERALERPGEVSQQAQVDLLYALGTLRELQPAAGEQDAALGHYLRALELAPGHQPCRRAVVRLLATTELDEQRAVHCQRALDWTTDLASRKLLLQRLAQLWQERLGDPLMADKFLRRALALEASDLEALDRLAALHRAPDQQQELAADLEQLAARARDPRDAVGYLMELAELLLARDLPQQAAAAYHRALELDPRQLAALEGLERIFGGEDGAARELARVWSAMARLAEDVETREASLLMLAGALEAEGELERAAEALAEACLGTENWVIAREHRRLRQRLAQWDLVAEGLQQEAALGLQPGPRSESLLTAAGLLEDRLARPGRAAEVLRRLLSGDPLQLQAAQQLRRLHGQQGNWAELVAALLDAEQRAGQGQLAPGAGAGEVRAARVELLLQAAEVQRDELQQPRPALESLQRARQLSPHDPRVLVPQGRLLLELERWEEALDPLTLLVQTGDDPAARRQANLDLAEVHGQHLDHPRRAICCYQNALFDSPDDPRALEGLYQTFIAGRDWSNAADVLSQLVQVTSDPQQKREHYFALSELYEVNEPQLALQHLQQAQAVDATSEEALARLTRLLSQMGRWEPLCEAVTHYLAALPPEQQARGIPRRLELGEMLQHRLGRVAEGLEQFRRVIEIQPDNLEARLATAHLLVQDERLDEALIEHREVLRVDPLNVESLRQMQAIWARTGHTEGAHAAAAVLVYLGDASDEETRRYRQRRDQGGRLPRRVIEPSALESVLVHSEEHPVGRRILALLYPLTHRLRPQRVEQWGVGSEDRLLPGSEHPLEPVLREVQRLLDLEQELDVYLSGQRPLQMDLLFVDPPALALGDRVLEQLPAMQVRAQLGRLLVRLRTQTLAAHGLDAAGLEALLRGACAAAEVQPPPATAGTGDPGQERQQARLIRGNLGQQELRALNRACRELESGEAPDYSAWCLAMEHTALRTALWVVNDLETALELLEPRGQGDRGGRLDRLRADPLACQLLQYWLSEEYLSLVRG